MIDFDPDPEHVEKLALGLAAWTTGATFGQNLSNLYRRRAQLRDLCEHITTLEVSLRRVQTGNPPESPFEQQLSAIVECAKRLLEMKAEGDAISLVSKLLHFLSREAFCIFDSRVAGGFRRVDNAKYAPRDNQPPANIRDYERLQATLWRLDFHHPSRHPNDRRQILDVCRR